MDKELKFNTENYLKRSDAGGQHRKYRHGDVKIGMYNFAGQLEEVFEDLTDAVQKNKVGATYVGIVNCITGRTKKHAGKIWRKEESK